MDKIKNLQDIIVDELAVNFQKTVDYDILCDVMIGFGHTVVEIDYHNDQKWSDVMAWATKNCTGGYQEHLGKWLFELEKDAIMFKLKWQ